MKGDRLSYCNAISPDDPSSGRVQVRAAPAGITSGSDGGDAQHSGAKFCGRTSTDGHNLSVEFSDKRHAGVSGSSLPGVTSSRCKKFSFEKKYFRQEHCQGYG